MDARSTGGAGSARSFGILEARSERGTLGLGKVVQVCLVTRDRERMMKGFHARVKTLFAEAIARPAEERDAFLEQACGEDAELRRKVEALTTFPNRLSDGST